MPKVLVVEDEARVQQFIRQGLEENGFRVDTASDGEEGNALAQANSYDVIVLDLVLPRMDGKELCRRVRATAPGTKVLMLTALGALEDKLEGFGAGADDYLVKPFDFPELLARVRSLAKRSPPAPADPAVADHIIRVADLELNTHTKRAKRGGQEVKLTAKEYGLLELFVLNRNRVLSKAEIAEKVWNITFDSGTNVIEVYVNFLRRKIDHGHPLKLIHTMVGMGYILKDDE